MQYKGADGQTDYFTGGAPLYLYGVRPLFGLHHSSVLAPGVVVVVVVVLSTKFLVLHTSM